MFYRSPPSQQRFGVGIGDAESGEDLRLQRFHAFRFVILQMIMPEQVKQAVYHQMGQMVLECHAQLDGPKVWPGTADPALGLTGRLNITLRETGLRDSPSRCPTHAHGVAASGTP